MQTYAPDPPSSEGGLGTAEPPSIQHDVTVASSLDDLPALHTAWRDLADASSADVFTDWSWSSTVAHHYAATRRLDVILGRRHGVPIALAPLAFRRFLGIRTLASLGGGLADYSVADYQNVLLAPGFERAGLGLVLEELQKQPWDLLWLQEMPAESPVLALLPEMAQSLGWRVEILAASDVHRVDLPETWEAYVAGLSSSWRKEVRSKLRSIEAQHGATFALVQDAKDIDAAMESLFDLHTQRWNAVGQTGIFESLQGRAFYRDLAHVMFDAGELYLGLLRTASGEAVGAGFGFQHGDTRYAYTYGYKVGPGWDKASLGLMMDCYCIRTAIEAGFRRVDLMRSEGEYKRRYGAVRADNSEVMVFRSRSAYLRVMAYRRLRRTAKRVLKKGH